MNHDFSLLSGGDRATVVHAVVSARLLGKSICLLWPYAVVPGTSYFVAHLYDTPLLP